MIFSYQKTSLSKYGPVVPLYLKGTRGWFLFNAFVDSGADYSVFHSDVALMLGIKVVNGKRMEVTVGDGDAMPIFLHEVTIRFTNMTFDAPIAFSSQLGAGFNLLGRAGFFERFKICFHEPQKLLFVTKVLL